MISHEKQRCLRSTAKILKVEFSQEEGELIFKVQDELESAFDIKFNILWMLEMHILNFEHDFKRYIELFKKGNLKRFLLL